MGWYAQTSYPYEKQGINGKYSIGEIGCFLTAFCNLLQRFNKNIDPKSLNTIFIQRGIWIDVDDGIRDDLGWESITAYDGQVKVQGRPGGAGWPPHNNAIVKFYYKSQRTGQMVTHFCLVADAAAGTVIDSWDGVLKKPGIYGTPVAWAAYENVVPQPVVVRPLPENTPPTPTPAPAGGEIRYEVLYTPKKMHTNKEPTKKWAFGNARTWSEFGVAEIKKKDTNVEIVAIAHHPVPPTGAQYFMDALALGDYQKTGRVNNTIGYSWADLDPGWVEKAPTPPTEVVAPPVTAPAPAPSIPVTTTPATPVQTPTPTPIPVPDITPAKPAPTATTPPPAVLEKINPNAFKATFKTIERTPYIVRNDSPVIDLDNKRPTKQVRENQGIIIGGTFTHRNTLYARPAQSVDNGNWYGIPMTNLIAEDELLNLRASMAEKVGAGGTLTLEEMLALHLRRLKSRLGRLTGNKN